MPKESVRDKLFFEAEIAEPLTSHVRIKKIPRQFVTRVDALLEGNMVRCHNNLRNRIFD